MAGVGLFLLHATASEAGSRFVERILTVLTTLKQQKRNIIDWLTMAVQARISGTSPPSSLPVASS